MEESSHDFPCDRMHSFRTISGRVWNESQFLTKQPWLCQWNERILICLRAIYISLRHSRCFAGDLAKNAYCCMSLSLERSGFGWVRYLTDCCAYCVVSASVCGPIKCNSSENVYQSSGRRQWRYARADDRSNFFNQLRQEAYIYENRLVLSPFFHEYIFCIHVFITARRQHI